MKPFDLVRKRNGQHRAWNGYILGTFDNATVVGQPPDVLVRYHTKDKWAIEREFVGDLDPLAGFYPGPEAGLKLETLTFFREVETYQPPPVVIPPTDPNPPPVTPPPEPPIEPDPETPEDKPMPIKMTIVEQTTGTPTTVGDYPDKNVNVILFDPKGNVINVTTTGAKGTEFGPNSFEAGWNRGDGKYKLVIGNDVFYYTLSGSKRHIKLHFERTGDAPPVVLVRLVSKPLDRDKAEGVLGYLDKDMETQGMFKIEAVK